MKRSFLLAWAALAAWCGAANAQPTVSREAGERFDPCSSSSDAVRLLAAKAYYRGSDGFDSRACPSTSAFVTPEETLIHTGGTRGFSLRGRAGSGLFFDEVGSAVTLTPSLLLAVKDLSRDWQATASYTTYVLASESPDVISAASRAEDSTAHRGTLSIAAGFGRARVGLEGGILAESGFFGFTAGASVSADWRDGQITPRLSYLFGRDARGVQGTPIDLDHGETLTHIIDGSVSIRVDPATLLVYAATTSLEAGDLGASNRHVPVFTADAARQIEPGATLAEIDALRLDVLLGARTPASRERIALLQRVVHRFDTGTLRFDERLYIDSWGLKSSTTDVRSFHRVARTLHVGPHLRAHVQDGVDFWRRAYVAVPTARVLVVPPHRTPDTNLSPLVAVTAGAAMRWSFSETLDIDLTVDGIYTHTPDALYVTHRWGVLSAAMLNVRVP